MATWSTAFVNNLPDSAFLYIEPGGTKDADGKTVPRSNRHFPVKDDSGKVDLPHVRNALARIPQSNLPDSVKKDATAKAQKMLGNDRSMEDLATVDLEGVEIMAVGGPVLAHGSPPGGEDWSRETLEGIVEASRELEDEFIATGKVVDSKRGHFGDFGDPALGRVSNARMNDEGTKLIGDVRAVPKKFAELVKVGAFPFRSAELAGNVTSQRTGKKYPWVLTGLAWGGAKQPAMRTLDEVRVLFEDAGLDVEATAVYEEETGSEPDQERLFAALSDLIETNARLVAGSREPASDTRATVTETATKREKYTDEQARQFAEATGVELDKVTDDMLAKAGVAEPVTEEPKVDPEKDDEGTRAFEQRVGKLEERAAAAEKRAMQAEADTVLVAAMKEGRITPGEKPGWEQRYFAAAEAGDITPVVDAIGKLPANETLAAEYGSGETDDETKDDGTRAFEAHAPAILGIRGGLL